MKISVCTINDVEKLNYICRLTFTETFEDTNTPENLNQYLDEAYAIPILTEELLNPDSVTYLVSNDNDETLGYLKLNRGAAQTEEGFDGSLEIQRIYIAKHAKGKGIGSKLMEIANQKAYEWNCSWIWLGVWEHNEKAKKFYVNKGFSQFSSHTFCVGDDPQTDLLLKKDI